MKLLEQAKKDYKELKAILEPLKNLTLIEVYDFLEKESYDVFNLEENLFDINYKTLCCTFYEDKISRYCDIWSKWDIEYYNYDMEEVK